MEKCINCKYFKEDKQEDILGEYKIFVCTNPETFQTSGEWWQDSNSVNVEGYDRPIYVGDNFGCVNFVPILEDDDNDDMDESVDARQSHGKIVKELMHKYKKSGKIGNTKPKDTEHAEEIANANAYDAKGESVDETFISVTNRLRKLIEG